MILDDTTQLTKYASLLPGVAKAASWLEGQDLEALAAGENRTLQIAGESLFVMILTEPLKPQAAAKWEAHRRYVDIQVLLRGTEGFGWCPLRSGLAVSEPHDNARDVAFYGQPEAASDLWFNLNAGQFVIFFPEDVHAPCLGQPGDTVRKVVFKIEIAG